MPKIQGRVTAGAAPRAQVYVRLYGPSTEFVAEEYTGDDGAFTFHVVEGTWRLEARAAGSAPASVVVRTVGDDVTTDIDLDAAS